MKFLKSSSNVIIINLILFYIKKIKKKKTIIFYHPNENLILIHQKFIEKLLRNNNYFCIYLHQNNSLKKNNYYFVINYFCKLIFNSDYFISNNVCDFFSQFSKRIYIHHDVYDTPLVNKKKQQRLKQRLLKYNNIFLASKNTKLIFDILFKSNSNRPVISIIGYFKLDYILKKKKISQPNSIVLAPTNYVAFKKFSLYSKLDKVISILLKYTNHKIVFRPHPSNLNSAKVKKILKKYKNSKKFYFDKSADYSKIYNDSLCLITDISGTAYTYAFYTKNPVVFYANYQKKIEKKYKYLNYFKDRKKIGKIFRRLNQFKSIDSLFTNRASYKKNINKIIVQKISIGKTKENFFKELKKL